MRRPLIAFALFVMAYVAVIGGGWFRQSVTAGEMAGHAAKIQAILALLHSGDFAWFPDYLSGSASATLLSFALSIPVYAPALLLLPDPLVAMKTTALALLAMGGFAAFAFGRRASGGDGWAGFAVGCAWLMAPQVLLRAGALQHMTILVVVPLVPLAFLAMLRLAERGALFDAVLMAATWSATMLAWSKMGATLVLPLAIFAGWLFAVRPECRSNLLRGAAAALPVAFLLGVVPLLPLLRERGFMTVFELDPLQSWQAMYSAKSATAWFDRGGALFESLPKIFHIDEGAYYLGIVGLASVAGVIAMTWRKHRLPAEVALVRVFLFIAFAMFWLSFGPRSVIAGHFELLAGAEQFPDAAVVLHWLVLAAQGLFLFWCVPRGRWRLQWFAGIFAVYLFVPAFRVFEHLPIYADLRAPDSFWILNGSFAWAVASALAAVLLIRRLALPRWRTVCALLVLLAACLDFSTGLGAFHREGSGAAQLRDYEDIATRLRGGNGRVLPITTLYFPLDLPLVAGRPLATEALNHYLMPREMARLQTAARLSASAMLNYFRLGGIRNVLLVYDATPVASKWFRSLLPQEYANGSFAILSNPDPLYPGFFASAAVSIKTDYDEYREALKEAEANRITIVDPTGPVPPAAPAGSPRPFQRLDVPRTRTPGHVFLTPPGRAGWVVLSESWHPDWKALVDGSPATVLRAAGGFPSVAVGATSKLVEFRFVPPAWYAICLVAGAFGWLLALLFLGLGRFLPTRFRSPAPFPSSGTSRSTEPISSPIALVPTYNEAGSIEELLTRILRTRDDVHALVIDDGSPDGTAAKVRTHSEFGVRVHLLERSSKQGLGTAYRAAFRWAIDRGYDACIEIDADLSHDPADIPRLLTALDAGADAAIGSRYLDGVRVVNWPRHRLLLSAGASKYVHALTGLPLTDATSGFKAMRASALKGVDWTHLRAGGYGFQIELHWLLWKAGFRLVEVPIVFTERRAGATKMTTGIAIEAGWRVLQLAVMNAPRHEEK